MKLTFLGAAGTVTGSKYLLASGSSRVLVDCGLFQGLKQLRLKNWADLPIDPISVDAVVLTHAHIDHTGYLPLLVRNGFKGKVYCSHATRDLCAIMLPDSAHLQEEEARYANKKGFSKHHPALPLYTKEDAERALELLHPITFGKDVQITDDLTLRLSPSGHILGSAFVHLSDMQTSILFSGDIGRPDDALMQAPSKPQQADYLVVESTYGNRLHEHTDPLIKLEQSLNKALKRGGIVIVPVFAVGRAQEMIYYLHQLKQAGRIPDVPMYLNSPMAVDASEIFNRHCGEHRLSVDECNGMFKDVRMVNSIEESQRLNQVHHPMILLAASGMASGGRVVHHLKAFAPNPKNMVLFVGYQAAGTRGAAMLDGVESIKIHGEYVPVNAEIAMISNLSAHADYSEILQWMSGFKTPPKKTFITHGEPVAADAMRLHIEEDLHWNTYVPDYLETVELK
jgi:metallo-beta-lactamase family protein